MNKTKIEWATHTWNPITGCFSNCSYCYARKISMRFQGHFKPTFHPERLKEPYKLKKPSKIFVCSMGEIFSLFEGCEEAVRKIIDTVIDCCPRHIFQFLTQRPFHYKHYDFPRNAWLGATIKDMDRAQLDIALLRENKRNTIFLSFEPLLADVGDLDFWGIDWIIIGAQTNPYKPPKKEWVESIIKQARKHKIPVFLKDNLKWPKKIQEWPKSQIK